MKRLQLSNGDEMPALGLGTWKSARGEVGAAVRTAIELGYRHLDCAAVYGNEAEIGEALAGCFSDGLITREQLWITSKLWNDKHEPDQVGPALDKTLADLRLDYLDLYLMHWPVSLRLGAGLPERAEDFIPPSELPLSSTWAALEAGVRAGKCRHIGVSNFGVETLRGLLASAAIAPAANQVEMHPYLQQPQLVEFCRGQNIIVTAYSPLGSNDRPSIFRQEDDPVLLEDPTVAEIAGRRGVTPAQVLLAWAVARGTSVIPKSVNAKRLAENLAAAEVELAAEDMQALTALDRARRYVDGALWAIPGSPYSLETLWA